MNIREENTAMNVKQETHDAPQMALTNHLEHPSHDHAEHEGTNLKANVKNDKVYAEHHDGRKESESVGQDTTTNHYFMKIEPEKKSNKTIEESEKSMRINDTDAVKEDDNEVERGQGDNRDDSETFNVEVTHTHEVQRTEKDESTPPHTQNGPKDWPLFFFI